MKVHVLAVTDNGGAGGALVTGRTPSSDVVFYADRERAIDLMYMLATEDHIEVMVEPKDLRVVERRGVSLPSSK